MHRSFEKLKMVGGDGGRFLGNRVLKCVEISWSCYHHPYVSPHEITFQMDAWILRKCKNG